MKIAVLVKTVPDSEAKILLTPDGKDWVKKEIKFDINPYDEYAIEAALQLKEAGKFESITVIGYGQNEVVEGLRKALAMGADDAIHIQGNPSPDPNVVANAISNVLQQKPFDLILAGKSAIDDDYMAIGTMVATKLQIPAIAVVVQLEVNGNQVICESEMDGGIQRIETSLPAVITCQKGLNTPRYPSLKGIMAAKKKTIEVINAPVEEEKIKLEGYTYPEPRVGPKFLGKGVEDVPELVKRLKEEAKAI
ncbi:MAG: electron transfer flavoprotein subunit beta/FixA family protein [bacterium]|nr:electron transfer flavoprotein subunit beta/FixA family protein [bacterium]